MKIRLKKRFKYQDGPRNTVTLEPGVHDVSERIAGLAMRFAGAVLVPQKKAPENKVVKSPESKATVAKKRRSSAGTKPND